MVISDRSGLPIAARIASGPRHEQKLVVETIDSRFTKALPRLLIGDKAYDSDPLDAELARMGVEMISPPHPRRRNKIPDGRKLRRYKRRWKMERVFAWLGNFRRLVVRWDRDLRSYRAFFHMACLLITLRQL